MALTTKDRGVLNQLQILLLITMEIKLTLEVEKP
jgi:hypothetical protein